jgi:hypothetical protein
MRVALLLSELLASLGACGPFGLQGSEAGLFEAEFRPLGSEFQEVVESLDRIIHDPDANPVYPASDVVSYRLGASPATLRTIFRTLATRFPGVYAVGDVNGVGTPKAGVFAEGAARAVAAAIIAQLRGGEPPAAYEGAGSCYIEFGDERVGRVDVNFLGGPKPTGTFQAPSDALVAEKLRFGSSRARRWFGREWTAKG